MLSSPYSSLPKAKLRHGRIPVHSCSEGVSVQMSCGVIRVSSRQGNGKKQKDVGFCGGSAGSSKGELVKKDIR